MWLSSLLRRPCPQAVVGISTATFLWFVAGSAFAQVAPQRYPAGDWIIDRWTSDQGLPQNTVNDIVEGRDGFLWIATYGGLVKFDGVRFTTYSTRDHPELGSDRVIFVKVAHDGSLWVGTDRSLVHIKDGVFHQWADKDGRPAGLTSGLVPNPDGSVWVAGTVGGLALLKDGKFERFTDRGLPDGFIGGVWIDAAGGVWTVGPNSLFVRPAGAKVFQRVRGELPRVGVQLVSGTAALGILWYDPTKRSLSEMGSPAVGATRNGYWAHLDRRGGFWTERTGAVVRRDSAGTVDSIAPPPEAGFDEIRALFIDRQGSVWVGTNTTGLSRLRRRTFRMYTKQDGLAVEQVAAVYRDRHGRLLIGTSCFDTYTLAGTRIIKTTLPRCVFAMDEMPDGSLVLGGYGGVTYITPDQHRSYWSADSIHTGEVTVTYVDRDSTLWLGTGNGLVHVVRGKWVRYSTADGLPDNQVHLVTRDRSGNLWIGTVGGLARLDGGRFTSWTTHDGLPHNAVRAVYEDADGVWWIGTYGGGLGRFDGKTFVSISTRDGLFDAIVSSIHEDAQGNLWMSGNRGVFRANRRVLNAFARGETPFVPSTGYGPSDGLLTVETNGGFQPSSWQDADGRLWFATVRGLATVDPKDAIGNAAPPVAAIEALRVDGRAVPIDGARLPAGSRSLEIDYTGLTSSNPEQLIFRYRIDGLDGAWQYVNTRRTAYISQIPHGTYTFVVSAANPDGVWSANEQRLTFMVPALWFESTWFRALLALALVAAAATAIRQRIVRQRERERVQQEYTRHLLAGQEAERRRIAGELHDSLSQDLLVMKNSAAIALNSIPADLPGRSHVEQIVTVAASALKSTREMSHGLRPHHLDILGLTAAIQDLADRTEAAGGPTITVASDGIDTALGVDERMHVFRIVQEALNNVMKHADATQVDIRLSGDPEGARIRVTDNGRGMDLAAVSGFGLTGIRQRVQNLRGRVDIQSAAGRGTTIELVVPRSGK